MIRVLLAADGFLTPRVMSSALGVTMPDVETTVVVSTWPDTTFHDFGGVHEALGDEDSLIEALQGCQACFTHTWPVTERVLAATPGLRLVTVCRGGPVNVDRQAATEHGVVVTFTPGRNATATAEHTIGMILAAARQIAQRDEEIRRGLWRSDFYNYGQVGPEISGSTAGVIGVGAVGSRVAHILGAMGAEVLAFDPWADQGKLDPAVHLVDSLEELMSRANIVTIHARVTPENLHLVGAHEISLMPQGAILVNCARGQLLDYDAVAEGLERGQLFAAAFDCFSEEPLPPDDRLRSIPAVTMTPHLGGASKQASELAARIGAEDIRRFFAGERPLYCENPEVFDKEGN
jgi:D-3-phosphoglycerate dehydrogenase / 2-oxoglutarate reductase